MPFFFLRDGWQVRFIIHLVSLQCSNYRFDPYLCSLRASDQDHDRDLVLGPHFCAVYVRRIRCILVSRKLHDDCQSSNVSQGLTPRFHSMIETHHAVVLSKRRMLSRLHHSSLFCNALVSAWPSFRIV